QANRSPLFQVKFVLRNIPRVDATASSLNMRPLNFDHEISKFDILLNLVEIGDELVCNCQYDSELFDASTIRGLLRVYQVALTTMATDEKSLDLSKSDFLRRIDE